MRLYHTAIATLVFLLSFSILAWDLGDERDFKGLVEKSQKEQAGCQRWVDETKDLPVEKLSEHLSKYPGTPPSTKALWKKVKEMPKDDKLDFTGLYQAGQCRPAAAHELAKRLIDSSESFIATERPPIAITVLKLMAKELDSPTTLVSVLSQLDVAKLLVEKKLVTLSADQSSLLQELGKRAADAVSSLRKKSKPSSKDFYRELELAETIRPPLLDLVSSLR